MAQAPFDDDVYAVILAGGSGTRFWPKSRRLTPKQLTRIGSFRETMLETTLKRLDGLVPPERRIIVTHQDQAVATRAVVGHSVGSVLAEPEARNTANALAMAALEIEARAGSRRAVMLSLHADHVIKDLAAFQAALARSIAIARTGLLTLIAIKPEYPETGFGYIEQGVPLASPTNGFQVKSFREKPDLDTATEFVKAGRFYWNAGLFVWSVETILSELNARLPASIAALDALAKAHQGFTKCPPLALAAVYKSLPKISIDHAVLEVSSKVAMTPAAIGWQDVGSWSALERVFAPDAEGNLLFGDGCLLDSTGTTIDSDGPFVAALGVKDLVVVAARGAVLVCPKDRDQDVKKIVEWLESHGKSALT